MERTLAFFNESTQIQMRIDFTFKAPKSLFFFIIHKHHIAPVVAVGACALLEPFREGFLYQGGGEGWGVQLQLHLRLSVTVCVMGSMGE